MKKLAISMMLAFSAVTATGFNAHAEAKQSFLVRVDEAQVEGSSLSKKFTRGIVTIFLNSSTSLVNNKNCTFTVNPNHELGVGKVEILRTAPVVFSSSKEASFGYPHLYEDISELLNKNVLLNAPGGKNIYSTGIINIDEIKDEKAKQTLASWKFMMSKLCASM